MGTFGNAMRYRYLPWGLILFGAALLGFAIVSSLSPANAYLGLGGWRGLAMAMLGALFLFVGGLSLAVIRRQREQSTTATASQPASSLGSEDPQVYDTSAMRIPLVSELYELYHYRYLLWSLISRDLKIRYKRSFLGIVWAMINPLLTMAVLLVVFTRLFRFDIENYPLYILAGLLVWNLYARGTSVSLRSVLDNTPTLRKIHVPPSIFVWSGIGGALVNMLFALIPLMLLTVLMGVSPKVTWLLLPIPVFQTTLFTFGVGVILASLSVFFTDMIDIYQVLLNAYFYLTPIIYPVTILPPLFLQIEQLNPMFHFMELFRAYLIYGNALSIERIALPTMAAALIAVCGWALFTRLSDEFLYRA